MDSIGVEPPTVHHVVAIPFPCQGHTNAMMSLCKLLYSRINNLLITFVVTTEEWRRCIVSVPTPANFRLELITPNIVERPKGLDYGDFNEAVMTNMEAPFEQLLDRLEPPVARILADFELQWPIDVGCRRKIPVASLWTMSASFFLELHRALALIENGHLSLHFSAIYIGDGEEQMDTIPGITSTQLEDLQTVILETDAQGLETILQGISKAYKTQYLLVNSVYELEPRAFDTLKAIFAFPVYSIGPATRYLEIEDSSSKIRPGDYHLKWLDSQPKDSVLYFSLGSFIVVSDAQMDAFAAALRSSGVRFFWVARAASSRLKESCGDMGLVVQWCDQLRVLCHPSVGGFLSHCGWNSTQEAVYAGVPMLTFPQFLDQIPNSRQIVEDWKTGWSVNRAEARSDQILVPKEAIAELVERFMDLESREGNEIRERARELKNLCRQAIAKSGSSYANLDAFICTFFDGHDH
ncbi:UDP-glycosyltransferase 87A1-like [Corylus avellana]|uniref:UDP-glycosyltransferase 87A1-like n=1 Tax=Corylus avellana TaxID=13451 RepID=UPI00286C38CB|nr:UDP-glycosyltransferase 87A1-like [Corylus avellana]